MKNKVAYSHSGLAHISSYATWEDYKGTRARAGIAFFPKDLWEKLYANKKDRS